MWELSRKLFKSLVTQKQLLWNIYFGSSSCWGSVSKMTMQAETFIFNSREFIFGLVWAKQKKKILLFVKYQSSPDGFLFLLLFPSQYWEVSFKSWLQILKVLMLWGTHLLSVFWAFKNNMYNFVFSFYHKVAAFACCSKAQITYVA